MHDEISSRDNALIKQVMRLITDSSYRKKNKLAVISGRNLIVEALKHNILLDILVSKNSIDKYADLLQLGDHCKINSNLRWNDNYHKTDNNKEKNDIATVMLPRTYVLSDSVVGKINLVESDTDIIGVIKINPGVLDDSMYNEDCIILENISDPGNLGTILRAAGAVGIKNVLLSKNSADAYSPKVLRSSVGIQFSLNILSGIEIKGFLAQYQGNILATTPHTTNNMYKADLTKITAWVFGNEANGISPELLQQITTKVKIPMSDNAESLNVAMAATVCLFEMMRQREVL